MYFSRAFPWASVHAPGARQVVAVEGRVDLGVHLDFRKAAGIEDLQLGVIYLLTMEIGLLTPPFGLLLFVMRGVAPPQITMGQIYRSITPFLVLKLLVLGAIIVWPEIGTWLPAQISR